MLEFVATLQGVNLRFGIQRTLVTAYRTSEVAHIHTAMPGKGVSCAVRSGDSVKKARRWPR